MLMWIEKWKNKLNLNDWTVNTIAIDDRQVDYPDDIEEHEKLFVGVNYDLERKISLITHSVELIEEDIVHELLHVANPTKSEEWIENQTNKLLHQTTSQRIYRHRINVLD